MAEMQSPDEGKLDDEILDAISGLPEAEQAVFLELLGGDGKKLPSEIRQGLQDLEKLQKQTGRMPGSTSSTEVSGTVNLKAKPWDPAAPKSGHPKQAELAEQQKLSDEESKKLAGQLSGAGVSARKDSPPKSTDIGRQLASAPADIAKGVFIINTLTVGDELLVNIGDDYVIGQAPIALWVAIDGLEVDAEALDYKAGDKVYTDPLAPNDPVNLTAAARRFVGWVKRDRDLTGGAGTIEVEFNGRNP